MSENGSKVIAAVREIAAEQPDFIYNEGSPNDCQYVDEGPTGPVPGCLVGQALWRVGLIDANFIEDHMNTNTNVGPIGARFHFDPDETSWLGHVQDEQDNQVPWSRAVTNTDALV